jgi:hypothetical protein
MRADLKKRSEVLNNIGGYGLGVDISDKARCSVHRNPLIWVLPLQAFLLFWKLDLLDPWGDEWFTVVTAPEPLGQVVSAVAENIHPPLYFALLHYWIQVPWPVNLVASMRAMSAVWALSGTVVIYYLWLRRERPQFQAMFLLLWALSPCLLLHARMARSYSMELVLASLTIYTALRCVEDPGNWKRLLAYIGSNTALLYTHYLSGFAVAGGACVMFLIQKRFKLALAQTAVLGALYVPWVPTLISVLRRLDWFAPPPPYEGGNVISDQMVRLAYWFISFSFGETFLTIGILLSIILGPFLIVAIWRGVKARPPWLPLVLTATGIGWIGVSHFHFEQFVFMPNQLLWVLPFFLLLIVRKMKPVVFVMLLVLYASADYAYFTKSGFLVKPYATPYKEMAEVIQERLRGRDGIIVVDPYGVFSEPLLARLHDFRVIGLYDETSAREVLQVARSDTSFTILLWRRTTDISPAGFVSKLEQKLRVGREVWRHDFVAYNLPERWARRLLRGAGQPDYYYRLSEFQPVKSDEGRPGTPN